MLEDEEAPLVFRVALVPPVLDVCDAGADWVGVGILDILDGSVLGEPSLGLEGRDGSRSFVAGTDLDCEGWFWFWPAFDAGIWAGAPLAPGMGFTGLGVDVPAGLPEVAADFADAPEAAGAAEGAALSDLVKGFMLIAIGLLFAPRRSLDRRSFRNL